MNHCERNRDSPPFHGACLLTAGPSVQRFGLFSKALRIVAPYSSEALSRLLIPPCPLALLVPLSPAAAAGSCGHTPGEGPRGQAGDRRRAAVGGAVTESHRPSTGADNPLPRRAADRCGSSRTPPRWGVSGPSSP